MLTLKGEDMGQLDQWWLRAVLAAIGEILEDVSRRRCRNVRSFDEMGRARSSLAMGMPSAVKTSKYVTFSDFSTAEVATSLQTQG